MKLLLLGSDGQVGWELQRALTPLGDVTALGHGHQEELCGDLEHLEGLRRTVRRVAPQVIVNAAAYTSVDEAESEPDRVERINSEAPGVLATEASRLSAWLVHYSTDYVFDGTGSLPWREDDETRPLNVYGATKCRGEQAVRAAHCRHLIFRTQWVYSARKRNFLRTILRLATERDTLNVVDDHTGAPTGAELIADITAHALRAAMIGKGASGTYHLAARGETTWHGYACFIIGLARRAGWPIRVADDQILPTGSEAFPTPASRPANSRLDVNRLEEAFGLHLPDWRAGVARVLAEMKDVGAG